MNKTHYNKEFYTNNITDYNHVFNELQDYILDEPNIKKALSMKIVFTNEKKKDSPLKNNTNDKKEAPIVKQVIKPSFFIPKEKDTLFWCFYIMKNGDTKYEMIEYRNLIIEKKIKIEYIEKIRKEKQLIKTYKFNTLTNIENNLLNDDKLDVKTFLSLCVIENLNVLFIKGKCYYELAMNDENDLHIVYCFENGKYGYELNSVSNSETKKASLYQLDNIEKPIKAISAYKVQDLLDICNKLGIETVNLETTKSKSKKDLYEAIIQYF